MAKPHFIIICREAFLEAGTNNLNLIRIFSTVSADRFPYLMPPFCLVVNFDTDGAGSHVLRTDLAGPDEKQIAHTEMPVQTTKGNWQVIANFEHLQMTAPGTYTFTVALDGEHLGSRTLEVKPTVARAVKKPGTA